MSSATRPLVLSLAVVISFAGRSLEAQVHSATVNRGVVEAGTRVPFRGNDSPPELTPEQIRKRDEELEDAHPGPPIPVLPGATVGAPSVPATPAKGASIASLMRLPRANSENTPAAPGSMMFYRATGHGPYASSTSAIAETHAGASGSVVFMSGNWFASYSTNSGSTFQFVNPSTQFPSYDGGFCCDQTVIHDRPRDQIIWQLQYQYSPVTQKNTYVTAFAPSSLVQYSGWCTYLWSPSIFGLGAGLWLDYPNVALSDNYVWYTANVYNSSDVWQRTVIWRVPLAQASQCSGFNFDYLVVSDRFNFALVQGATSTMYWATHNNTSSLRVYRWAENSNTIYWDDVGITTWPNSRPYSCPGPDGLNWCGRAPNDGRIQTGWVAGGVIGFMWNASGGGGFPYPHIRVVRLSESTRGLLSEPLIWYPDYAWQFPAIGVNDRGHIGGSAYWGGGAYYPTMTVLVADDYSATPPPWENYGVVASAKGASSAWGDWYSARRHGTSGNTWITTGQAVLANSTVQAWYVWFGRERDNPIAAPTVNTPTSSSVTTTTAVLGGTVSSDGGASITERGVVYSPTATNSNPLIGGSGVTKVSTSGTTGAFTVNVSSLTSGTQYSFKAYAINSAGTGYTSVSTFTTSSFAGPTSLTAAANSPTQVALTWSAVANASYYEIARSSGGGFTTINTSGVPSYTDNSVSGNVAYLYKVRAVDASSNYSTYSPIDAASTFTFNDDPLAQNLTLVKAVHVTQLRTAVNALRVAAGLLAATFTDPSLANVEAIHITELRSALDGARAAFGASAISYTDPSLATGTTVKAVHVQQLRTGVK